MEEKSIRHEPTAFVESIKVLCMENIIEMFELLLLSIFPQNFTVLYLSFMLWGVQLRQPLLSAAVPSLFLSVYLAGTSHIVPFELRPISWLVAAPLIIYFSMAALRVKERLKVILSYLVVIILHEMITVQISLALGSSHATYSLENMTVFYVCSLAASALLFLAAYAMNRFSFYPLAGLFERLRHRMNGALWGLLILFTSNVIISGLVFVWAHENNKAASFGFMLISGVNVVILLLTLRAMACVKRTAILSTQDTYIDEINRMFTSIRGQRHDFLNHVQVIHAFVSQGKHEELERYTSELVGEIKDMNELLQIGHPALAALIKSKMVLADEHQIEFRHSFHGLEFADHGIASVDYVKIAGNLIDNAFDEVMDRPPEERWVEIRGWTDETHFYFSLRNPGPELSESERQAILQPGYTTKVNKNHSGLGLSIVKERVDYYKGELRVENGAGHALAFHVCLPIRFKPML